MAASIGGYEFVEMVGPVGMPHERVQLLERPGVSGVGLRLLGRGCEPFVVATTTDLSTAGAANTAMVNYRALVGSSVTVVDTHARSFANVFVLAVMEVGVEKMLTPVGVLTGGFLLRCQWTLVSNDA